MHISLVIWNQISLFLRTYFSVNPLIVLLYKDRKSFSQNITIEVQNKKILEFRIIKKVKKINMYNSLSELKFDLIHLWKDY